MIKEGMYKDVTGKALLEIIRKTGNRYHSIILFGHNPSFDDLASGLAGDFQESIPPSGVVGIEFRKRYWREITPKTGQIKFYDFPTRITEIYNNLKKDSYFPYAWDLAIPPAPIKPTCIFCIFQ